MSVTFSAYSPAADSDGRIYFDIDASGPNTTASNANLILRSLGYTTAEIRGGELDPAELAGRLALAQAFGGEIPDDGMPDVEIRPGFVSCGVPAGYLAERYRQLAELCEEAIAKHSEYIAWV